MGLVLREVTWESSRI